MSYHPMVPWSEDMETRLEHLWKTTDLSALLIAKQLGTTRDAVAGKAARMFGPGERRGRIYRYTKIWKPWSQDELDILLAAIREGLSNADIAGRVGRSKNAVKHKAASLGLSDYRRAVARKWRQPPPAAPTAEQRSKAWLPLKDTTPIHITDLTSFHCPWPLWGQEAPTFLYCGQAKDWNDNYCQCHRGIAVAGAA